MERPKANANIKNVAPKKIPTKPPVIDTPSPSPFARMRMPSRANSKASPTKLAAVLILSNRLLISIFAAFPSFFATFVRLQGLRHIPPAVVTVPMENLLSVNSENLESSSSSVHWDPVTAKTDVLQLICSASPIAIGILADEERKLGSHREIPLN